MSPTAAIVLFSVIWFMVFFIMLQLPQKTQSEAGEVVPGTPRSAPANPQIGRKAGITTLWAFGLWLIIGAIILSGRITIRDLDWFGRMSPPRAQTDQGLSAIPRT
jgi:predicted secreted protein